MVREKETGVNRQSRVRGGMVCPGQRPRLCQGLSHHHRTQVEGFQGPMSKVPEVMTREGGVPAPCTHLQYLVDREILLRQKRRVTRALKEGSGMDLPESWYALDIVFQSQKEIVFFAISFVLRPAVMNSRSHCG